MSKVEERLKELGYELPTVPPTMANYVSCVQTGNVIYTSGAGCYVNGNPMYLGRLGLDVTIEQGYEAAKVTVLNLLAILKSEIGDLDRITRIVKLFALVSSAPDFYEQPRVVNGASDFLIEIFGEAGKHARAAAGTSVLPFNNPIEIEMIVEVNEG
ncbi:RidA family protein [Brevibacillus porteri]|uniref:Endoribonuclease L-PSP/chorismate mutase-like domain-containing protein n=1 Tax=Brevibacillus porteri TaxID=2126350 RepID=A0ABX5FN10_9BACL|nr:RidA family protein [Brevibacillus porteri]MED1802158.1 RidA family protein [Brevibacillus porteri]MED2129672.1 RidA family protein [Brevibacillus porteri]MED2743419.1 RidA family protein [Brevibacillus porteri]MED2817696.1 RidA family protein [Brevibacillus porteri]MED2897878.1 RidA family protein [Brevibacillus porteri]